MIFYIILSIVMLNLFVSIYCLLRKRHGVPLQENESKGFENSILKKFILKCVSLANDVTFLLFKITGYIPSHVIRKVIYKYIYHISMGKNVVIYYGFEARSPWNIKIDDNSIIGDHAIFDARYGISIGSNVNLSNGVWIWTLQHNVNSPVFGTEGQGGPVKIKDRAWVSSRTTLLPNITIEEGVVIAAGAVVATKHTKPFKIYGGIPAKEIAMRNDKLDYKFDGKHRLFI